MNTLEKISAASAITFGTGVLVSSAAIKTATTEKMNYIPAIIGGTLTVVGGIGMIISNYLNGRENKKYTEERIREYEETRGGILIK